MHLAIRSTENQKQELFQKGFGNTVSIEWIGKDEQLASIKADVYFDLTLNDAAIASNSFIIEKPVFVHAVNCTCKEINQPNYIRLNAWNGFLNRTIIEVACKNQEAEMDVKKIFNELTWRYVLVADDYGFVAARIIAMIINEAYYALEENVSTKQQIDTAMKLGTNYAYGPFEWCEKIGRQNILTLLEKLAAHNSRYTISSLLVQESQHF